MIAKQHITLDATEEAITLLAEKGYDPAIWGKTSKTGYPKISVKSII